MDKEFILWRKVAKDMPSCVNEQLCSPEASVLICDGIKLEYSRYSNLDNISASQNLCQGIWNENGALFFYNLGLNFLRFFVMPCWQSFALVLA